MTWFFASPQEDEIALLDRAAELQAGRQPGLPTREELASNSRIHGVDLATAMALQAIRREPENRAYLARLAEVPISAGALTPPTHPLVLVPTMYHRERPELGGDGALVRQVATRLGIRVSLAPTTSLGDITGNAAILTSLLEDLPEPAWFLSISKGTSDLKRALMLRPDLFPRMAGWISLAGMPGGTPLAGSQPGGPVAQVLVEGWLRLRGATSGMLAEMTPEHPYSQAILVPPPSLPMINVVPMPMRFHLRRPVDRTAGFLARFGPNDGYVPLANALLPGRVVPLFGADHYLRVPELTPLLYQLLRLHLSGRPTATPTATVTA